MALPKRLHGQILALPVLPTRSRRTCQSGFVEQAGCVSGFPVQMESGGLDQSEQILSMFRSRSGSGPLFSDRPGWTGSGSRNLIMTLCQVH